jgi:magnesium chelatase subunit D
MTPPYPFAALVGQDRLRTALLLAGVNPAVGGVLIRGEKGTAKSTAARGLARLLPPLRVVQGCPFNCDPAAVWAECPHCGALDEHPWTEAPVPFLTLPLGATEDRVVGTLDFERVLREGRRAFEPGLLAAAHRGILYIDEVNLLSDHLVDVLLDAAAMGVNSVQREGVAITHPARFILVGTMNPEEGDLRPQLLDRFGLMVDVTGPRDPAVRAEVVRRRIAFEDDPVGFSLRWAEEEAALGARIAAARERLADVRLDDGLLTFISHLCCEFEVDGLRADIVMHKAARTLAAWGGRTAVTVDDVRTAAELVLPHRRRRRPFEQPGLDPQKLEDLLSEAEPRPEFGSAPPESEPGADPAPDAGSGAESHSGEGRDGKEQVFASAGPHAVARLQVAPTDRTPRAGRGRRNPAPSRGQGHYVRAVPDGAPDDLAVDATVRAAARRGAAADGRVEVTRADLHRKERVGRAGTLILFVVDASGSMAVRRRMEAVKGATVSLLLDAYQQRDQVGVIAFRGIRAEVLLPPTHSVDLAEGALRTLPTGGRTPLAHALVLAGEVLHRARRSDPELLTLLVVLSDGKANVPLPGAPADAWQQAILAAGTLAEQGFPAVVLDTDTGFVRVGRAEDLARALAASYLPLDDLSADALVLAVRQHRAAP